MTILTPELASRMTRICAARQVLQQRGLPLPTISPLELALRPAPRQCLSSRTLARQVRRSGVPGKR